MIVVTRTWIALTVLALMVSMLAPGVASAQDDDLCASTLVDMIRQAGLDVEQSAPALGCHQAEDGSWYMPTVADLADETVMSQLDPYGTQILAAVDRMATDQAFASSVLFERTDALIMVPGIGGVYERIDASAYGIGSIPTWLHSYQDSHNQAVQLYLTRTAGTEVDLVLYMQWMMSRRDATLGAMAAIQNPMAATAFLANGGYQQFPWPWQLADPAAIAAFTGQAEQAENVSTNPPAESEATKAPTATADTLPSTYLTLSPSQVQARAGETVVLDLKHARLQGIHSVAFMAYSEGIFINNVDRHLIDEIGDAACSPGHEGDIVPPIERAIDLATAADIPPAHLELVVNSDVRPGDRLTVCVEMIGFSLDTELLAWNAEATIEIVE